MWESKLSSAIHWGNCPFSLNGYSVLAENSFATLGKTVNALKAKHSTFKPLIYTFVCVCVCIRVRVRKT